MTHFLHTSEHLDPHIEFKRTEFQKMFMKYLMERRENEYYKLHAHWCAFDDLSGNFEGYVRLDKEEGMNGKMHHGMSLNQIEIERDIYAAKLRDHTQKSDAECMHAMIRRIKDTWCRGVTPVDKMLQCAICIMDVFNILPVTCTVAPYVLSNRPKAESIRILSNWLCTHCDEFWVPEEEVDVWEHLQYICNEFEGSPKKVARFVSRYTWENTQEYLKTTRHYVARPWNTDPNVSDDEL